MRVREESTGERRIRRFSESLSEIRTLLHRLGSVRDDYARNKPVSFVARNKSMPEQGTVK
jgi:hypothetical protein